MAIGWLWQFLYWMSLPALAAVAGILVWRRLHREFPLFLGFLLTTEAVGLLRLAAQIAAPRAYPYVYWTSDLAIMMLNFLAVAELLIRLFPRFYRVRPYRLLFSAASSVIIFAGWVTAFESSHRVAALLIEARVLDFVMVAMLTFLIALMLLMGREWTRYEFGIAFGFAINAAASLITSAAWVRARYQSTMIDQLPLIAFDISCLVWLITVSKPKKGTRFSSAGQLDAEMLREARSWETLLKTWLTSGKGRQEER